MTPSAHQEKPNLQGSDQVLLSAREINKSFPVGDDKIEVLKDIKIDIHHGEFVAIMGKSGSGKSTLLSILAGLDMPSSGQVMLKDEDLTALGENALAKTRQHEIAFVFQSFHLIPSLTVEENVAFPLQIRREANPGLVDELISKVDLQHRRTSFPYQLSGGEKQRTAIARALITSPAILFADEPTGNLDEANAVTVMELLKDLQREFGTALVVVTHDEGVAAQAGRVIRLVDGQIQKDNH
ncbi:ABC transporter ATP-binding protein [Marinicella sp. W31]|uniref:ABC transporter ATP-binding protein n=1 Tax=Marinicella sp. W31 TaxID=3023713 RepID=UPI003756D38F